MSPDHLRADARARRALTVRVGLALLLGLVAAACIFEQSNYQGGGRRDDGAAELDDAGTEEDEDPTPAPTTTTTSTAAPDAGAPPLDAGVG